VPVLTVVAGPNGSGKSTLIAMLREQGIELGVYFNADDIAKDLKGPAIHVARQAQEIVRAGRAEALDRGISHSFETVMSHISHVEYMREARAKGFEVRLYFVATDHPEVNVMRVANRVSHGGHNVPKDRIVSRYYRCLKNLPAAIATSDTTLIFDNSQTDRPHWLLAHIKDRILFHDWPWVDEKYIGDRGLIPSWWLAILLKIKPANPFAKGSLP
jgi:predicted ABC-type ATPase